MMSKLFFLSSTEYIKSYETQAIINVLIGRLFNETVLPHCNFLSVKIRFLI